MSQHAPQVIWRPQEGPQTALIQCPVFEVFFGGARGGGKTESSIGDWLEHSSRYGQAATGVFFRRTAKQLEEVIARTKQLFKPLGADFKEQKSEWMMPNGARLKFRYLERDADAEEYQGHSYTRLYVEEATNFPSPDPIDKLRATLRSAAGVPCGMRLTGNPGGPGHQWVKARYIKPNPMGFKIIREEFTNPFDGSKVQLERVFIPSRLSDNPLLMQNDPSYVARLQQQGSASLVKAWLTGDWDIVVGAYFDAFDPNKHVLRAADWLPVLPYHATRFGSFDWGSAKPFSMGWYIVSDGSWGLPVGALLRYDEYYGWNGKPNVGLKMDAAAVAGQILAKEREWKREINYRVADPAAFIHDGGPSQAETMLREGCAFRRGDNKRKTGWDQCRARLAGPEGGEPMMYFLDTNEHMLRLLPAALADEHDPEDVDTDQEDHALDEWRYACMSRPVVLKSKEADNVIRLNRGLEKPTFKQIVDRMGEKRRQRESEAM